MSATAKDGALEPTSDDAKEISLQIVHRTGESIPGPGPGRPLHLDTRRFIRICQWIEKGESASEACRRELVTYQGFRRHVQRNSTYQRRLKEAEIVREHWLREYHIANVVHHAPRNVIASLWWLERRYPNEFALRTVNRDIASAEALIGERIPADRLAEYGKLMLEMAEENKARELKAVEPVEQSP